MSSPLLITRSKTRAVPQRDFRLERLVIHIEPAIPRWLRIFMKLTGWFGLPWLFRAGWSDDGETFGVRWRLGLWRPAHAVHARIYRKLAAEAEAVSLVHSIKVDHVELIIGGGPMPVMVFSPVAIAIRMAAPVCRAGRAIELELEGPDDALAMITAIGRVKEHEGFVSIGFGDAANAIEAEVHG